MCTSTRSLLDLPFHILDDIIDMLQRDAIPLGTTNSYLNHKVNKKLYKEIVIVDKTAPTTGLNCTVVPLAKLPQLVESLSPATTQHIRRIKIMAQTDGSEHVYMPLYNKICSSSSSSANIQVESIDINNLRNFRSITQLKPATGSRVAYENEEEQHGEADSGARGGSGGSGNPEPPKPLKNWTIFDFEELRGLPRNESVKELSVYVENVSASMPASGQATSPPIALQEVLPNLKALYLNSPASTLSFFNSVRDENAPPLQLDRLSLTNSHSFKNFGYKSINTKLYFQKLSRAIDMGNLKELELKLNCDFHNRCEENCIIEFFREWEREYNSYTGSGSGAGTAASAIKLEKLVLINFKSNSSQGNLRQFHKLINDQLQFKIFGGLQELYVQIDDFSTMMKPSEVEALRRRSMSIEELSYASPDIACLKRNIMNTPGLRKVVLPDFFGSWFVQASHDAGSRNYLNTMVNKCDCSECDAGRQLFAKYAKYDSMHGFQHKFRKISEDRTPIDDKPLKSIDATVSHNYRFTKFLVSTFKEKLNLSQKNLFSVNSVLKAMAIPGGESEFYQSEDFKQMTKLMLHSFLLDTVREFSRGTNVSEMNLGGVEFTIENGEVRATS